MKYDVWEGMWCASLQTPRCRMAVLSVSVSFCAIDAMYGVHTAVTVSAVTVCE